jgi:hypothetical protein
MASKRHVRELPARRSAAPRRAGELPRVHYLDELAARGYAHVAHDEFPGTLDAARLARLGEPVLVRASADGEEVEAFLRLAGGPIALLDLGWGSVSVEVAAARHDRAARAVKRLRRRLARPEPAPTAIPFAFWSRDPNGGAVRHRDVDVPVWERVRHNYTGPTAARLDHLMELAAPAAGRLLIWHGVPGTGKTYALRALSRAWREWCAPHYVLDPEALLRGDPSYLLDVLTWGDAEDRKRWRLLVLEDAGELVRRGDGAGLGPLLNLTDGLLGQGTRALVLITTNEPIGALDPAVRRPGRCLCELEFGPLDEAEAHEWLARAGTHADVTRPMTLSDLYAVGGGGEALTVPARPAFGFSRALR